VVGWRWFVGFMLVRYLGEYLAERLCRRLSGLFVFVVWGGRERETTRIFVWVVIHRRVLRNSRSSGLRFFLFHFPLF